MSVKQVEMVGLDKVAQQQRWVCTSGEISAIM